MLYVKTKDNKVLQYPYSMAALGRDYPNVSFPSPMTDEVLNSYGVFSVVEKEVPKCNWYEDVQELNPTYSNGKWIQTWQVYVVDSTEKQRRIDDELAEVRAERNRLLAGCDWTQLPDVDLTVEQKLAWKTYRQALRDLLNDPAVIKNPFSVIWPSVPSNT